MHSFIRCRRDVSAHKMHSKLIKLCCHGNHKQEQSGLMALSAGKVMQKEHKVVWLLNRNDAGLQSPPYSFMVHIITVLKTHH